MITDTALGLLFPHAEPLHRAACAAQGQGLCDRFMLEGAELDMFLAMLAHESGGLMRTVENLNYTTAAQLMRTWPKRFPSELGAKPYVRQPEKLANHVYAGRMGNGLEKSGDGWRYRGRGYLQVTGKSNYREVGSAIGLDLLGEPDQAAAPEHALAASIGWWLANGMAAIVPEGIEAVRKRVNGGLIGLAQCQAWLGKIQLVQGRRDQLGIDELQAALNDLGFGPLVVDGVQGPKTEAALAKLEAALA